jgi:N-methylhydantoinase B
MARPLEIRAPAGTVVNADFPAAVAGGNVETSQRIVDVVLRALARAVPERIPAASCGSMNNVALGGRAGGRIFAYYETLAGGAGRARRARRVGTHAHDEHDERDPGAGRTTRCAYAASPSSRAQVVVGDGAAATGSSAVELLADARVTLLTERRGSRRTGSQAGRPARSGTS